ncbi:MAG: hypothetical protein HKN59_06560 [Gammaproteobacteria bacterium]|nr:hypothetical protein [Gammaproteobacteria bacterium]
MSARAGGAARLEFPADSRSAGGPGEAVARQCALKLWSLRGLFIQLADEWQLDFTVSPEWPGLALSHSGIVFRKTLELQLQGAFFADAKEFYEISFVQAWRAGLGGRECQRFCCGRIFPDDVLCEKRVRRELAEKALLLGLSGEAHA